MSTDVGSSSKEADLLQTIADLRKDLQQAQQQTALEAGHVAQFRSLAESAEENTKTVQVDRHVVSQHSILNIPFSTFHSTKTDEQLLPVKHLERRIALRLTDTGPVALHDAHNNCCFWSGAQLLLLCRSKLPISSLKQHKLLSSYEKPSQRWTMLRRI